MRTISESLAFGKAPTASILSAGAAAISFLLKIRELSCRILVFMDKQVI
jgi:hypothetical protein